MSTKFEQLLDYLVNEDHEKANELFHEIVVEKSREIYENLIAEEEEGDEEDEEERDEVTAFGWKLKPKKFYIMSGHVRGQEGFDSEEDARRELTSLGMDHQIPIDQWDGTKFVNEPPMVEDDDMDLEDSYNLEDDDKTGDKTDDLGGEISADGGNFDSADGGNFDAPQDDAHDHEGQEDEVISDFKNAIQELEAAFAKLERVQGAEEHEMGMPDDVTDDDEDEDEETEGMGFMEGRRMTREYVEKVGHNYGSAQTADGDYAGAGTGETQSKPVMGSSPVSSGKGKPESGAGPIKSNQKTGAGTNVGNRPGSVDSGITPQSSEKFAREAGNVPGGKMGVKNLKKVGSGYPGNNQSAGPVGSGTGDKAGQTSVTADRPFLKKI